VQLTPETAQLFGAESGYYFLIWNRNGTVLNGSQNAPLDSPRPTSPERDELSHFRTRGDYREAVHCSGSGDCVMAGRSMTADLAASRALGWTLLGAGAAILILGFGLGWLLVGRAIRPIDEISGTASRIARGDLSERINVGDLDDEIGRLANVLNSTFARLEAAFLRQQQFTSDAAHELRTPLSILISEAQTTLTRPRTADEYREIVEGGLETAQQMRKITETLLELARFDADDPSAPRKVVDLAELAARCADRVELVAEHDGIVIKREFARAEAFVVPGRLEVVIANLLTNALYYIKPGGGVTVRTYSEAGFSVLEVSDTGIGIASEDLPHIFDRFYRADKARSRSQGHAGLGLAICKTIVEAERGEISVLSKPQEGTTFMVRFATGQARQAVALLNGA
jgi:two-component system, OmpR family, sensor kinase